MADIGVFPSSLATDLASPSLATVLLAKFDFGDGSGGTLTRRFHAGAGTFTAGGYDWQGVTDPAQTRLVKVGFIELPTVKIAAKVDITLTGVDSTFLAQVRADVAVIYGAPAEIYFQVVNPDTYAKVGDPVLIFDNGICGMPRFKAQASGLRAVTFAIDGIWANKNFAPGGRLNDADQQSRYSGDIGLELVGSAAYERIK